MAVFDVPDGQEAEEYLRACVVVEDSVITEEYMRLPSDIAYWTEQYAEAKHTHLIAKHQRERTLSSERGAARATLEEAGHRATEGRIDEQVISVTAVETARTVEIMAEVEVIRLHGVLEALRAKKEMLISLGAHLRQERAAVERS